MEPQLCPLFKQAIERPDQIGLLSKENSWSYAQLNKAVNGLCHQLKAQGIKESKRVAFVAKTEVTTILFFWALFRLKAIACPLSTRIPEEQLNTYLSRLRATHWIDPNQLTIEFTNCDDPPCIHLETIATFLFTSGSSGISKIACHRFANHYYSALGALEALQLSETSQYLLSLPLFHVSGISILFRTFLVGGTLILSELPLFETLHNYSVTHLSLVPTQLYRLLQDQLEPPTSVRCLLLGGAPAPIQLLQLAATRKWPVYPTYGMTETSSMITLGKVLPFREVKIQNQEIYVRGKTLFLGYWDSEQEVIIPASQEGWFATRDLGDFNQKGELEILGRKDRQFISGGENIQPEEIERALCSLPGIVEAYVSSIEDLEFGKRPIAFVKDSTGLHTLETIQQGLKTLLPTFKHPIQLFPWSSHTTKALAKG